MILNEKRNSIVVTGGMYRSEANHIIRSLAWYNAILVSIPVQPKKARYTICADLSNGVCKEQPSCFLLESW
jgi:hypothetical protein